MNTNFENFLKYFSQKQGEVFSSPRALFGRGEEELFTVVSVDDENKEITLKKEDEQEIIIEFSLIKEAVLLLEDKNIVSIIPEKISDSPLSLEEHLAIWQSGTENITLNKNEIPYVADLIVLSGVAAYGWGKANNGEKFAAIAIKGKPEAKKPDKNIDWNTKKPVTEKSSDIRIGSGKQKSPIVRKNLPGPVLITYSTRHGSTADIAWSVKNSFQDDGIDSEVKRIQDVDDVRKYSLVIIGAPIYNNKILHEAVEFTRLHKDPLSKRMTALFVVGASLKDKDDEKILKTLKIADEAGKYISPEDVGMFAGKLLPENLPIKERINAMFNQDKTGDFRDWRDIGEWADKIKKIFLQKLN